MKIRLPSGPMQWYAVRGGKLLILGDTTAGQTLSIIYKSKNWLQTTSSSATYVEEATADANVSVFPDNLTFLGFDAFYRKEKGLAFSTHMAEFTAELINVAGNDNVAPILHMDDGWNPLVEPGIILPASGFQ